MYGREYLNTFYWQCDCEVEYNDIFFHVIRHHMKYTADYIRAKLAKYITKYMEAVCVVIEEFLWGKGLTIKDYLLYINQPGNRSDELSVYLVSRFCQRYIAVITKDGVWFMGKNTSIEDCHIVLVYLGEVLIVILNSKVLNLVGCWEHQGCQ